jgi:hypothetical protein
MVFIELVILLEATFHITACKMNYTNDECADRNVILGEARGNSAEAEQLYAKRFPTFSIMFLGRLGKYFK